MPDSSLSRSQNIRRTLDALEAASPTIQRRGTPTLKAVHAQIVSLQGERQDHAPQALRSLHHFACTGGTLITKALAAMPNTVAFSEIDPLSTLHLRGQKRPFFPTDLLADLHYSPRPTPMQVRIDAFQAALNSMNRNMAAQGSYLLIRDHAHSQFCTMQVADDRPTVHAVLSQVAPVLSAVTVRHPLESYMSLQKNKWVHFTPGTFEQYCVRYLAFLDAYKGIEIVKYEDFVADPQATAAKLCALLKLPFNPEFEGHMSLIHLSGDSGRSGAKIAPRDRRPVSAFLRAEANLSSTYSALCNRLAYAT